MSYFQLHFPANRLFLGRRSWRGTNRSVRLRVRLCLEVLEDRWVPSTFTVKNLNDMGPDSLRQAILDANSTPGDDTINFAPGVTGAITLASALPDLSSNIDLEGPGPANLTVQFIPPAVSGRIFHVTVGATATIAGLTISGGLGDEGGGIANDGTLTVHDCTVAGNTAAFGGGIANLGTLTLSDSTVTGNTATGRIEPRFPIQHFDIFDPGRGGGIYNDGGVMTIDSSTVASNSALGGFGGGVATFAGTLTISNSTVALNIAQSKVVPTARFPYFPGSGGGIWYFSGTLSLSNSTVASNSAVGGGAGGLGAQGLSNITVYDTIIAQNTLQPDGQTPTGPDVSVALLTSRGHNLIGDGTGGSGFLASDLVGTSAQPINPSLGPLQDNGGPTPTMALLPYSLAIDAGDNTGAPATDQRGQPRIANGVIDIGAFEYQGPFLPSDQKKLQLFVASLYQTVLDRVPASAELTVWVNGLNAGLSRQQVAHGFWASPEHRGMEVDSYYATFLHRAEDLAERALWVNVMLAGMDETMVEYYFLTSLEYRTEHPTAALFVTGLYADLLGRPLDLLAQAWVAACQTQHGYGPVAFDILTSPEMTKRVVDSFYLDLLQRPADSFGELAWMAMLQNAPTAQSAIAEAFLASEEFFDRAVFGA